MYLINFFPKIQIPGIKHINEGSIFKKSFALGNELYPINHDNKMPIFFFISKAKYLLIKLVVSVVNCSSAAEQRTGQNTVSGYT